MLKELLLEDDFLVKGKLIGSGAFGDVFRGEYMNEPVAIKVSTPEGRRAQRPPTSYPYLNSPGPPTHTHSPDDEAGLAEGNAGVPSGDSPDSGAEAPQHYQPGGCVLVG